MSVVWEEEEEEGKEEKSIDHEQIRVELRRALQNHQLGEALCLTRRLGPVPIALYRRLGLNADGTASAVPLAPPPASPSRVYWEGVVSGGSLPALVAACAPRDVGLMLAQALSALAPGLDTLPLPLLLALSEPLRDALAVREGVEVVLALREIPQLQCDGGDVMIGCITRGRSQGLMFLWLTPLVLIYCHVQRREISFSMR
jgi:hypothetical protein